VLQLRRAGTHGIALHQAEEAAKELVGQTGIPSSTSNGPQDKIGNVQVEEDESGEEQEEQLQEQPGREGESGREEQSDRDDDSDQEIQEEQDEDQSEAQRFYRLSGADEMRGQDVRDETTADRRLVIIRAYGRPSGNLAGGEPREPISMRVMIDSGATGEFISPQTVKRTNLQLTEGNFGTAIEAFGRGTKLTQKAEEVELDLVGIHHRDGSGLSRTMSPMGITR
jgi:hypothetical protein